MADDEVSLPPADDTGLQRAGRQMTVAAVIISVFLFLGKVAGYAKDMLIAHFFGRTATTDAFYALYNALIFNLYTKVEKLMRPTYLPEFVRVRDRDGDEVAWRVVSGAALMQLAALVVIAGVLFALAPQIIRLLWPPMAAEPETFRIAVVMLRIMAPALVFFSLSIMPELTLHAYKRFTLPAVAEASFRCGMVLVLIAALYLVWQPQNPTAIYAAALGVAIGGTLRLVVQLPGLARYLSLLRAEPFWRNASVRAMVYLMPPVLLGLTFSAIRTFADSIFAVRLQEAGAYTCLTYGRKMIDAPLQVLPLAVSFVVYPFISQWAADDDRVRMGRTLVGMTRAMAFIFLPVTVGLMVLAKPIISLLFEHGEFDAGGVRLAALALYCYAPAIVFLAVEGSINKWYFALKDTLTPNLAGVAGVIIHVAIGWWGTAVLRGSVAAIALALTISKSLKVIALYGLLRGRVAGVDVRQQVRWAALLAIAVAIMGVAVWHAAGWIQDALGGWTPPFGGAKLKMVVLMAGVGAVGAVVYIAATLALGMDEVRQVFAGLRRKLARSQ